MSVVACEGFNGKQNESIAIERFWLYVYYTVGILRNKLNYILDVKLGLVFIYFVKTNCYITSILQTFCIAII